MAIIIKPIVTEKMNAMSEKQNRYAFRVDIDANKIEIKNAVEKQYGVKVIAVNTIIQPSKNKSRYTRSGVISGRTQAYKKAIVTVKEGDKIDFYSNI